MKVVIVLLVLISTIGTSKIHEDTFECGQRPLEKTVKFDDAGASAPGQWPWYGAVFFHQDRSMKFACGCILLSEKHVLIEAVCIQDDSGSAVKINKIMVILGTHKLNVLNMGFAQYRKVQRVFVPPYKNDNDIVYKLILELSVDVKFNDFVQPICIYDIFYRLSIVMTPGFSKTLTIGWDFTNNVGQLKTVDLNNTISVHKDRHSFPKDFTSITLYYYEHVWYAMEYKKSYIDWIAQVTNVEHLQIKAEGRSSIASQQYPQLLPRQHCGKGLDDGEMKTENVTLYEFPWMAQLYSSKFLRTVAVPYCTGTLINFRYVLTSYRCVQMSHPEFVRLGEKNINTNPDCYPNDPNDCAPPVRDYIVDKVVHNQNGEILNSLNTNQLIALIRTKDSIAYEDHIQPVCLPLTTELQQLMPSQFTITSWAGTPFQLVGSLQLETIDAKAANTTDYQISGNALENISFLYRVQTSGDSLTGAPIGFYDLSNEKRFVQFAVVGSSNFVIKYYKTINVIPYLDWIRANMEI